MRNSQTVDRFQAEGVIKAEVFVGRTDRRGWRWDITYRRITRTSGAGVEGRLHLSSDFGYARSERAAWRAVRKAFNAYPGVIV